MELDLVDCRHSLARGIFEQFLEVAHDEVRDTDVLGLSSFNKLLHLAPDCVSLPVLLECQQLTMCR